MKTKKRKSAAPTATPAASPPAPSRRLWICALGALAGLIAVFWAYSPALNGPFLFDDNFLPFATMNVATVPLSGWIRGVRPVLMFSYWVNAGLSGDGAYSYHVLNVLIHCVTSGLVFLIVRRLLALAGNIAAPVRTVLAGFAAAVFLLHPVQTEAVAYLAGRSESLSVMLAFAAFAVFLYRRQTAITWSTALAVLALFGAALLTKEHTIVLPALLLLTDFWWPPRSVRANWRLYAALAAAALGGLIFYRDLILNATTAGFGFKEFTWYQYFFTQCRALFVYLREFILPVNLLADWNFPVSRSILDHGAIFGLIALLALCAAAWIYRRRFPLASYGWFTFLLLMAPTSSIVPIQDTVAERRLYFAILGLLLIVVDLVGRLRVSRQALTIGCLVVLLLLAGATHARAAVWSDAVTLWQDNISKSPNKRRDHLYLAFAYYTRQRYPEAIAEFEKAASMGPPTLDHLVDWGLAYQKMNRMDLALAKFREATLLQPPSAVAWVNVAQAEATRANYPAALDALANAERIDPNLPDIYVNRGKVHLISNDARDAVQDFQRALTIDPNNDEARRFLPMASQKVSGK